MTETAEAPFSEALKNLTWVVHDEAEYTDYMQALLEGRLITDGYTDMVVQHYYAYVVLEEAAEAMRNDPIGGKFVFDELTRVPALEEDLEFLIGADWRDKIKPSASTQEYCDRMREVCFDWAGGFMAHHYTRYLGDLSGGQVIRAATERAYNLQDKQGVQFYVFPEISDYKAFKVEYRNRIDAIDWSDEEKARIVEETTLAYRLNTKVLNELSKDLPRYLAA